MPPERWIFKEEPRDPKTKWELTMVWVIQNSKLNYDGSKDRRTEIEEIKFK